MTDLKSTRLSLLVRIRDSQDAEAWGDFVEIYTPVVFRFLRRKGLQDADAADVTQDVFRAVARSIVSFEYRNRSDSFRNWLLTVTQSKFLDHVNRNSKQAQGSGGTQQLRELADVPVDADDAAFVEQEYRKALLDKAARMVRAEFREKTWQAFWLTQMLGEPTVNVAESLDMSVEAIYVARSRVLARLRERIRRLEE